MSNTSVQSVTTATQPHHRLGARVVVELSGTITSRDQQTDHYAIQPDHPRSSTIHVRPEFIFPEEDAPDAATGLPSENTAFTRADTSTHLAALEQRVQDAESGWRREAAARKAAEQRAEAAERKLVRTAPETCAIHAALRPIEDPIAQAIWNLTVLDLAFGHNRYAANGQVDQEWTAIGAQVGDALVFVREARKQFEQAWEAARGNGEPAGPADEPPDTDLAEFLDEGLAHVAVALAMMESNLVPSDAGDVHAAIAGHVSAALEQVKEARELMEAARYPAAAGAAATVPVAA
jgi:hypothetical protein